MLWGALPLAKRILWNPDSFVRNKLLLSRHIPAIVHFNKKKGRVKDKSFKVLILSTLRAYKNELPSNTKVIFSLALIFLVFVFPLLSQNIRQI